MNKALNSCFKWIGTHSHMYTSTVLELMILYRMRLRKKTWRSPGTVYLDQQVFEKDIHVFTNYEMFIEPLEGQW